MKKWLSALLSAALILCLMGCAPAAQSPASPTAAVPAVEAADPSRPEAEAAEDAAPEETSPPDAAPESASASEEASPETADPEEAPPEEASEETLPEDGTYTSRDDVALYLHLYGHLPGNFITKKEAEALGWPGGSLEPYAPGKCIGGSRFGNYEGLLPTAKGRIYTECDIDTLGAKSRGAKRIVFSNDGLIYYTEDHYQSFTLLYGEE